MSKKYDFEIEFDFLPPSVNHAYITTRYNRRVLNGSAKQFIKDVKTLTTIKARKERLVRYDRKDFFIMELEFVFPNRKFPDPNNLLKILIDSFEGIVFENDKWCLPAIISAKVVKGVKKTKVRFKFPKT